MSRPIKKVQPIAMPDNGGIEFENIENFSQGERQFSHQVLIMKCLNKAIEMGCVEMKEGFMETKYDKQGNTQSVYHEDTRRSFIEAVKTVKSFMACDFDEDAKKIMKTHLGDVKFNKQFWLDKESEWWTTLSWKHREYWTKKVGGPIKGYHNQKLYFKDNSLYDEIDIWRDILEELNNLTKRLDFYESTKFEG